MLDLVHKFDGIRTYQKVRPVCCHCDLQIYSKLLERYACVKLNVYLYHAKLNVYCFDSCQENHNVKVFASDSQTLIIL